MIIPNRLKHLVTSKSRQYYVRLTNTNWGAQMGMNRTYQKLKLCTDWLGMKDVEEYIQKCESCQKNKITQVTTKLPLQLTTTPDTIMQKTNIDVVRPINASEKHNRYILTMQDDLTKYSCCTHAGSDCWKHCPTFCREPSFDLRLPADCAIRLRSQLV
jgi:hypothetical protein